MKKFTKMLSTLMLLCVASAANAQDWQDVPFKGWVHEWVTNESQTDAEKLPDGDGVYAVFCRSEASADEAGNKIKLDDGSIASWDSQFFITLGEENALQADDQIKVTMSVKADVNASGIGSQAHLAPGVYKDYRCIPAINFTTEWADYEGTFIVTGDQTGMYTIAFNLALGEENTYYFKDIVVQIKKAKAVDAWTSVITNGDLEGDDVSCFSKTEQAIGGPFKAKIEDGVGKDGSRGIVVKSQDNPAQDWDTQLFISSKKYLPAGTKYHVSFDYKSDVEGGFDTQAHNNPGNYIFYTCIGSGTFNDSWQSWDFTGTVTSEQSTAEKVFYTIAFNLAKNKAATSFYFDNIVFEVPSDVYATLEDAPEVQLADAPEQPIEITWVDIMKNGDLEGDDASCIMVKHATDGIIRKGTIADGIGENNIRGVKVASLDREDTGEVDNNGNTVWTGQDWDAQFWIRLPQTVPAGTPIKVTFSYRATNNAHVDTQSHQEPGNYIHYVCAGSPDFTPDWQVWENETKVPNECDGSMSGENGYAKDFRSIAFNLSTNHQATLFFFDNIKVEIPDYAVTEPDAPEGDPLVWGDVNGIDGKVNSADVQKTYGLMSNSADGYTNPEGDVNSDGDINSADIQKIYSIMATQTGE